jgi:DNA polymerase III subunit chi
MTEISFHFNVPERTAYVCRLVRKAVRLGASVVITGPESALLPVDQALWAFDDLAFLPHVLLRPGQAVTERLRPTRVWLGTDASQPGHHDVLVNLGIEPPAGFESFNKLIEIVTQGDDDRAVARVRWKHYASRGYEIVRHEVAV